MGFGDVHKRGKVYGASLKELEGTDILPEIMGLISQFHNLHLPRPYNSLLTDKLW